MYEFIVHLGLLTLHLFCCTSLALDSHATFLFLWVCQLLSTNHPAKLYYIRFAGKGSILAEDPLEMSSTTASPSHRSKWEQLIRCGAGAALLCTICMPAGCGRETPRAVPTPRSAPGSADLSLADPDRKRLTRWRAQRAALTLTSPGHHERGVTQQGSAVK